MSKSMTRVLHLSDAEEWNRLLSEIGTDDVYFSPKYLKINETIMKGVSECFVYAYDGETFLYPYIRRPIRELNYFDITTPYGFGGYVKVKSASRASADRINDAFRQFCKETRIVCEFIRFHPLFDNHGFIHDRDLEVTNHQPVVFLDYDQENFALRRALTKEALKKIKMAERNQLEVIVDISWHHYQDFIKLYWQTMKFRQASDFYRFSNRFFQDLKELLNNKSLLLIASYQRKIIGGLLILFDTVFAYNFLSCSDYVYNKLGTNDLLQYRALEWAYNNGFKSFLLGGGLKGEDSLFNFKAKFSSQRKDFFIGRRIHLSDIYAKLCNDKMKRENSSPEEFFSRSWFPLYRSNARQTRMD